MKLYNTLTRTKEEFKPLQGKTVKMYNCGPTVYNQATLGNLRTYLNVDLLRRSLEYFGYQVDEVMNITDIEDKIIREAKAQNVDFHVITDKYEQLFLEDLAALNIEKPEHLPRATEEIPEMVKIIAKLLADGYAYQSEEGSVYFDLKKFKTYGQLSGLSRRELKAGARVANDEYEKENAQDFALWKAAKPDEPSWEAPFGPGRPGWHIECTAMSLKYLGRSLDIHAGGVDLIFPHHENEIAQSEAYTGQKFVNEWFHGEHLLINGERMGKSLGNFYVLSDLKEKFKVAPLAFRMLVLQSHYRDKLNFTGQSIKDAQNTLNGLAAFILGLKIITRTGTENRTEEPSAQFIVDFEKALADDLALPSALAALFGFVKEVNKIPDLNQDEAQTVLTAILKADQVLGLRLDEIKIEEIPAKVVSLVKEREEARSAKDFKKSDEGRVAIEAAGYLVEDTLEGPIIRKK